MSERGTCGTPLRPQQSDTRRSETPSRGPDRSPTSEEHRLSLDDIVGGVRFVDGSEAKIVSGIDDHSRFVVWARVVERATARPVCDALAAAMAVHGVPEGS